LDNREKYNMNFNCSEYVVFFVVHSIVLLSGRGGFSQYIRSERQEGVCESLKGPIALSLAIFFWGVGWGGILN
jgi:hypothetical protein